jgi:hypothetical protein
VTRSERTPLGLEVEVNDNGKLFTVRTDSPEGKLLMVRGSTSGLPSPEELPPMTLRAIRIALEELAEMA